MKKVFAMLLAAVVLCSVFAVTALADNSNQNQNSPIDPNQPPVIIVDGDNDEDDNEELESRWDGRNPEGDRDTWGHVGMTDKESPATGDSLIFPAAFVLLSGAVISVIAINGKKKKGK